MRKQSLADVHIMSNFDLSGMAKANARRFAALVTKFIAASSSCEQIINQTVNDGVAHSNM